MTDPLTLAAWHAEAQRRFPAGIESVAFECPSCGHIATVADYRVAGATEGSIGFSCIGRWTGGDDAKTFRRDGGPCTYAGGGLIGLNPQPVVMPDGKVEHYFAFAGRAAEQKEKEGNR